MKTSPLTLAMIFSVTMSSSVFSQHRPRGNEPLQQTQPQNNTQNQGNQQPGNQQKLYGSQWNNRGGNVTVQIGNYSNYGGRNYYQGYQTYYGNGYNPYGYNTYNQLRGNARSSIRQAAQVLGNALQFSDWNEIYSPWLAKAIRHQQYAKQLYAFGDFAGAINHAERAGFLAWNTLSYYDTGFNNGGYGYQNKYPNPYSDPNNPYYRQGNPSAQPDTYTGSGDDYSGYRKANPNGNQTTITDSSTLQKNASTQQAIAKLSKVEIDGSLPQTTMSDKDLLKTSQKDLDIE